MKPARFYECVRISKAVKEKMINNLEGRKQIAFVDAAILEKMEREKETVDITDAVKALLSNKALLREFSLSMVS